MDIAKEMADVHCLIFCFNKDYTNFEKGFIFLFDKIKINTLNQKLQNSIIYKIRFISTNNTPKPALNRLP